MQHDGAVVGQLHARRVLLERGAGGDIRYGITYMVLPAEAPRISPVSFAFISAAGYQLL